MSASSSNQIDLPNYQFPRDIKLLGLQSEEQIDSIKLILCKLGEYLEKNKVIHKGNYLINDKTVSLPLSIRKLDNQQTILMLLKKDHIIAKGGRCIVRKVYNLSKGVFQVKKQCFTLLQKSMYEKLQSKTGIVNVVGFYINIRGYLQVVEPLYQGDLYDFCHNRSMSGEDTLKLFSQLLEGLAEIHRIPHSYTHNNTTFTGYLNHADIKLENILFNESVEGKLSAVLADFDSVGNWESLNYTQNYESPELAFFCKNYTSNGRESVILFNKNYGRAKDIWSLGIVFSLILGSNLNSKNKKYRCYYLPFFYELLLAETFCKRVEILESLKQSKINSEIEKVQKFNLQKCSPEEAQILNYLWMLVNQMLMVNPLGRITTEEALRYIKKIA